MNHVRGNFCHFQLSERGTERLRVVWLIKSVEVLLPLYSVYDLNLNCLQCPWNILYIINFFCKLIILLMLLDTIQDLSCHGDLRMSYVETQGNSHLKHPGRCPAIHI